MLFTAFTISKTRVEGDSDWYSLLNICEDLEKVNKVDSFIFFSSINPSSVFLQATIRVAKRAGTKPAPTIFFLRFRFSFVTRNQ